MNFWSPFPFIRITVAFSAGILLQSYIAIEPLNFITTTVSTTIFYLLLSIGLKKFDLSKFSIVTGTLGLIVIALFGYIYTGEFNSKGLPVPSDAVGYYGVVNSNVENSGKYHRAILELENYILPDSILPADGRILLYIEVDSLIKSIPRYGDYLLVNSKASSIKPPSNPGEFNFASFWANKQILLQDFVKSNETKIIKSVAPNRIIELSFKIRNKCEQYLEVAVAGEKELPIAMALILGVKDGLDNEIKSAYAASGAMHVLAVSGLHVGILYLFILFGFKPWRDKKYGGLIAGLFSLIILWSYALVTGFSPSVQRAVVMFSIFIVGKMFKRQRNIYNSLAFSAFILLLINPFIIYEVGFQLSYLAVFGIVFLQPKLYQLWSPDNWLINKGWEITCVSIATQLATFPLGIFYFHQFPTLFLLSNLIVIPTAFLSLILGILILILAAIGLPIFILVGIVLNAVLWSMNRVVFFIEGISFSVLDGIDFNAPQIFLIYLFIFFAVSLLLFRNFKYLIASVVLVVMVALVEAREIYHRNNRKEVVVYDIRNNTVIDFRDGFSTSLYVSDSSTIENSIKFIIQPHRAAGNLVYRNVDVNDFKDWASLSDDIQLMVWNDKKFIRLSGKQWKSLFLDKIIVTDFLILSNDCVANMDQLRNKFSFDQLIVDGSNSLYKSNILMEQANKLNVKIHSTNSSGALILKF